MDTISDTEEKAISSIIPKMVMLSVFNNQLDKRFYRIAKLSPAEIKKEDLPGDKKQALTMLMAFWPGRTLSECRQILSHHDLEPDIEDIFFISAALNRVDCLNLLKQENPNELIKMLSHDDYNCFVHATGSGYLEVMNWLKENTEEHNVFMHMTMAQNFWSFSLAITNRDFATLQWFKNNVSSERFDALVSSNDREQQGGDFAFIRELCKENDLEMLQWFTTRVTDELKSQMFQEISKSTFLRACYDGNLDMIHWLLSLKILTPQEKSALISSGNNGGYINALNKGRKEVLTWLQDNVTPSQWAIMQMETECLAFLDANSAQKKMRLEQASREQKKAFLDAHNYQAFHRASVDSDFDQIQWLLSHATEEQKKNMLALHDYVVFRQAALQGRLDIMAWLMAQGTEAQSKAMIASNNYAAFQETYSYTNHDHVLHWLLKDASCLGFIEKHEQYKNIVNPFIQQELSALHQEHQRYVANNPTDSFDVNPNVAESYYYMLRNLIRKNDRQSDKDIAFLLNLPSIQTWVTTDHNALLSLAREKSNKPVLDLLRTIPAVSQMEGRDRVKTTIPTQATEIKAPLKKETYTISSMLLPREAQKVSELIQSYQPQITAMSLENIMVRFQSKLKERYRLNPASIIVNGKKIILPVDIPENASEDIMKAYYLNTNHTALRYITTCSQQHYALIAMYYLAAKDTLQPPTDDYTIESRLDYFVEKLALIGRAGNKQWEEKPIVTYDKSIVRPDDMEKDKPGSILVAKKQLLESLVGHPMTIILAEKIRADIRRVAFMDATAMVEQEDLKDIAEACSVFIHLKGDKQKAIRSLSALNIPNENQALLEQRLIHRYTQRVEKEADKAIIIAEIKAIIADAFVVNPLDSSYANRCHVLKFGMLENLQQFIQKQKQSKPAEKNLDSPPEEKVDHRTQKILKNEMKHLALDKVLFKMNDRVLLLLNSACDVLENDNALEADKEKAVAYLATFNLSQAEQNNLQRILAKKYGRSFGDVHNKFLSNGFTLNPQGSYAERCHLLTLVGIPRLRVVLGNIRGSQLERTLELWAINELYKGLLKMIPSTLKAYGVDAVMRMMSSHNTRDAVLLSLQVVGVSSEGKQELETLLREHKDVPWDDRMKVLIQAALTKEPEDSIALGSYTTLSLNSVDENLKGLMQKLEKRYEAVRVKPLTNASQNFRFFPKTCVNPEKIKGSDLKSHKKNTP